MARRSGWVNRESPFETLEQFRKYVLPALGLDIGDVKIEGATRFPQNQNNNKPAGMRVRFQSPEDRYKIFSKLGKLRAVPEAKTWHFSADFPEALAEKVKKMDFVAAEYRQIHPDHNTAVFVDKTVVKLQWKDKKRVAGKGWTTLGSAEVLSIEDTIAKGEGILQMKQAQLSGNGNPPMYTSLFGPEKPPPGSNMKNLVIPGAPVTPAKAEKDLEATRQSLQRMAATPLLNEGRAKRGRRAFGGGAGEDDWSAYRQSPNVNLQNEMDNSSSDTSSSTTKADSASSTKGPTI